MIKNNGFHNRHSPFLRFSPLSLFSSGSPGAWYDPSDYSTLFQDSLGTTPVTAVEQPVGLMLDKSQGLVLGSELVTNGNFNSATGWTPAYGTVITGGAAVFDGVTSWPTADIGLRQTALGAVTGKYYRISFTLLGNTTLPIRVGFWTSATSILAQEAGSYSGIVYNDGSSSGALFIWASGGGARTGSIDNISVKEIQGNHARQPTDAARPVLKIDSNSKYYLLFDGSNDSFITNPVSFTSTSDISVFAGVRKLSDAARGMIVELSATSASNNGTFGMTAPNAASATYAFESKGTSLTDAVGTPFAAPITSVLSGLAGISTDSNILRVNGVQADSDVGDQGTGNYGNYPLYIGRRGGSSLPFNGQLYSLIIVGKAVTAGELSSTEAYVNQKTGAY